ncbi:hypothetical protein BDZ97DRAFT_1757661 [Flammula alnicola]|nr:hypothetical protein BDZ97DRAFT_1757661 [Flammula alnicola]
MSLNLLQPQLNYAPIPRTLRSWCNRQTAVSPPADIPQYRAYSMPLFENSGKLLRPFRIGQRTCVGGSLPYQRQWIQVDGFKTTAGRKKRGIRQLLIIPTTVELGTADRVRAIDNIPKTSTSYAELEFDMKLLKAREVEHELHQASDTEPVEGDGENVEKSEEGGEILSETSLNFVLLDCGRNLNPGWNYYGYMENKDTMLN